MSCTVLLLLGLLGASEPASRPGDRDLGAATPAILQGRKVALVVGNGEHTSVARLAEAPDFADATSPGSVAADDGAYAATASTQDPTGPERGEHRVSRGGGWDMPPLFAQVTMRLRFRPTDRYSSVGFRLVRTRI